MYSDYQNNKNDYFCVYLALAWSREIILRATISCLQIARSDVMKTPVLNVHAKGLTSWRNTANDGCFRLSRPANRLSVRDDTVFETEPAWQSSENAPKFPVVTGLWCIISPTSPIKRWNVFLLPHFQGWWHTFIFTLNDDIRIQVYGFALKWWEHCDESKLDSIWIVSQLYWQWGDRVFDFCQFRHLHPLPVTKEQGIEIQHTLSTVSVGPWNNYTHSKWCCTGSLTTAK